MSDKFLTQKIIKHRIELQQTKSSRAPERVAMPRLWPTTRRLAIELRTACMTATTDGNKELDANHEGGCLAKER